ncbi:contact-dependent growth inhibition system immunity protein [Geothrix mesophila]|uniref:contact-dependent growth inhibition system immunity protein n=1 Tax=Geothrix mesophila TaxID=2922723 RepID=UPI001FAB778C|nr:contact-dependent growth inhibition system immunity protein [Geothrix sp. SG198]
MSHDRPVPGLRLGSMSLVEKHPCPCCGQPALDEQPPGTFAICPECAWEDDPVQAADPDARGGANRLSLREARHDHQSRHAAACFPNLALLMGAYFHQDWNLDAEDELGTVRLFFSMESESVGLGLREELRLLAEDAWKEDELAGLFRNLGGCLIPTTDWRGWVSLVYSVTDNHPTR